MGGFQLPSTSLQHLFLLGLVIHPSAMLMHHCEKSDIYRLMPRYSMSGGWRYVPVEAVVFSSSTQGLADTMLHISLYLYSKNISSIQCEYTYIFQSPCRITVSLCFFHVSWKMEDTNVCSTQPCL